MTEQNEAACLIAVDWGTTNFRAWLLAAGGRVLDRIAAPRGISRVGRGDYGACLQSLLGHWLSAWPQAPVIMAGMIGSANGWVEAPYLSCPIDMDAIAGGVVAAPRPDAQPVAYIIPGLDGTSLAGSYDVMRGEETQIIGAQDMAPTHGNGLLCVPGTHSKWVRVDGRRIQGFSTSMTGDAFKALRDHSFLARSMQDSRHDADAFARGLAQARRAGGLLHHVFSARTSVLQGELAPSAAASCLSGILIGHEVAAMLAMHDGDEGITVIGGRLLAPLYATAIRFCGRSAICIDGEEAACKGLYRLATNLELIDA